MMLITVAHSLSLPAAVPQEATVLEDLGLAAGKVTAKERPARPMTTVAIHFPVSTIYVREIRK